MYTMASSEIREGHNTVRTETRLGAIRMSENDELMQLKQRFIYGRAKRCWSVNEICHFVYIDTKYIIMINLFVYFLDVTGASALYAVWFETSRIAASCSVVQIVSTWGHVKNHFLIIYFLARTCLLSTLTISCSLGLQIALVLKGGTDKTLN